MNTNDKIYALIGFYGHKEAARRLNTTPQALSQIQQRGGIQNVWQGPTISQVNKVYGHAQRRMKRVGPTGEERVVWGNPDAVTGNPRMTALTFEDCYRFLMGIFKGDEAAREYAAITETEGARFPYRAYITDLP